MRDPLTFLLVEDEPLILLDLEFAVEDCGGQFLSASSSAQALDFLASYSAEISVAVLDVSLAHGETCEPVAKELTRLGIPFIVHSGDLDRRNETIQSLGARLVAKPARSEHVIAEAVAEMERMARARAADVAEDARP